jgi:O-antigen ligase
MPWLSVLIARRMDWTEQDVVRLLRLLTGAGCALVAIGILQYFLHISWFTPKSFEVVHEGRTTGTFANAVEYGSVLSGMALLTLAQFSISRSPVFRMVLLGICGAMVVGAIIALTRSPLVGLTAGLLVIYVRDRGIRSLLTVGAVVGATAAVFVLPLVMDMESLTARFEEMEPIYNRVALFATAGNMIASAPLLGVGFGRYAFSDYKTPFLTSVGEIGAEWAASIGVPHLEYLHIAVLTGLLGLLCYGLAIVACIRTLLKVAASGSTPFIRTLATYVLALLTSLLVNGFFVDFMAYNYFASLVLFMVGVASVVRPDSPGQVAEPR